MKNSLSRVFCIAVTVSAALPHASATLLGQGTTAAGQAFANACAGNRYFSGIPDPGTAFNNGVTDSYVNCSYTYSGVSGPNPVTASNAGSFFGNPYNNTATASAAPKQIHLSATNNGSAATEFSGASANGGWNDNYTLHLGDPGLVVSGTSGYWVAPVHVDGTLIGAIGSVWDYQLVAWGADQSIPGGLSVDQTVFFSRFQ